MPSKSAAGRGSATVCVKLEARYAAVVAALALSATSCSGDVAEADRGESRAGRGGSPISGDFTRDPGLAAPAGHGASDGAGGSAAPVGSGAACAKQTVRATQKPVYLAFAFDVSGSMGKGDKPWHDRTLKWDPVTQAARAFFEAERSEGFSASMTFFPADGGEDERCDVDSYQKPDVAMQRLPSKAFGEALDDIGDDDWRGGTPTLYVVQGVFDQIAHSQKDKPGRYALVLVTDGYPQDCDDDSIDSVASLVKTRADDTPAYVIGVTNPPIEGAPDVTTNLRAIARAGGTGDAHLIDTGNPARTASDFERTIEGIRSAAVACEVAIPSAPPGQSFDKQKVSVSYASGGTAKALAYSAECKDGSSWHYDDADQPREIVLCSDACSALQTEADVELSVDFGCEQVIPL